MIELNEAPHKLTNHNKMMMSKSYSVDSICNQDGGGVDKRVVLESRENQTTIVPPTSNSRFSSYKSAAALMRPGANTKSKSGKQQSQTKSVISNEQPRTNKLNKLKKQQASSASNYEISSLLVAGVRNSEPAFLNRTSIYSSRTNGEGEERAPPLSLMQKLLLDEQKIYSDPSDNYKRRTVVLVRPKSGASNAYLNRSISNGSVALNGVSAGGSSGGEFGFNLQAYGFLNKLTQQTEYICFVRNVESNSPASRAGLQSGDVLLAIDGVCLSEFRSFAEITQHVRGKNELRLVLMAENISKRIQCQLKAEQIRRILVEKRAQLDKVNAQAEDIMRKYGMQWPPSSLLSASSPMNASTTSASVTESGNNSSSSSSSSESSKCSGDGLSLTNSTSSSISASTAMSLSNTTPLQPPSHIPNTVCVITAPTPTSECSAVNSTEIQAHDLSSTKEDASGRLTINESTIFMSPPSSSMLSATNLLINQSLISSSDVTSDQEVVSSSLSQSSSFSSSAVPHNSTSNNYSINRPVTTSTNSNSVTTNGDNKPVIMNAMMMKSSTPVDPSLVVTSTAISTQKTAHKSNHLDKTPSSIMSDINNNNVINKPNKSSNGGLFKSSQPSVNNNPPTNKPSFARKYIESTSRLVRSASSSSMNLFSSLKSSLSSSNLNKVSVNHQIDGGSSEKERKRAINYSPSFSLPKQSQVDEMVSAPITAQPRHSISTNTDVETASMSSSASSAQAANVLGHPQRTNSLIEQLMNSRNKSTSSSSSSSSNNKLLKKHYLQQLANGGSNNNQMDSYQRQHYSFSKEKASNRTEDQTNTDDQQSSSRLSTQYSSDRPIVKLNNHYNTPNPAVVNDACSTSSCSSASSSTTVSSNPSQATNGKQQAKYHRNDFKNIFSLLSNKPKISSRMNRYRLDTTALTTTTTTTTTTTEQMATSVKQRPLGEQHLGRSMSCDFNALAAANTADTETETESESSPRQSVEQPEYSTIPVIDYTHDDYVITRL